jgi:hypothetical protein
LGYNDLLDIFKKLDLENEREWSNHHENLRLALSDANQISLESGVYALAQFVQVI